LSYIHRVLNGQRPYFTMQRAALSIAFPGAAERAGAVFVTPADYDHSINDDNHRWRYDDAAKDRDPAVPVPCRGHLHFASQDQGRNCSWPRQRDQCPKYPSGSMRIESEYCRGNNGTCFRKLSSLKVNIIHA